MKEVINANSLCLDACCRACGVSGAFQLPGAVEVCDKTCVGPACAKDCVREPDVTVGRDRRDREGAIIQAPAGTREPAVELERTRPGVDVEMRR